MRKVIVFLGKLGIAFGILYYLLQKIEFAQIIQDEYLEKKKLYALNDVLVAGKE